ncbi:MAG: cell division FtsK/SpoIIIE [Candidatus Wolfebacteria bacterium GW2011_GWC1_43_10]|uniref:Cell division FtsK/SpoIIIE n=1 Tax=Candidatus Wolfebacteria bacterium GW2011_GWC1_43_10 TaxID=1619011 RepID=A0A0G1F857_9BACT|nr:MAG: cell division FtsK/SpoIIIE [Candidatus Wolfebacteria bacterium GW2011_GWC1_43_10]KKT23080.1 MAG: Cell division FtsK/SpoIIIE [Parcubacteria group bacterium GW2011_GWB1_43_8b]
MSRHKKNKPKDWKREEVASQRRLTKETVQSVWALIFLALALVLVLAGFAKAGKAGNFLFDFLYNLFGWGYSLLPLTLFGISLNLAIQRRESKIYATTLWGALLFLISTLGTIDVFFDKQGGVIGGLAGYLKNWFSQTAWGIILLIAAVIGIVIVFDKPLIFRETKEKKEIEKEIKITSAAPGPLLPTKESPSKEETEEAIKEDKIKIPVFSVKRRENGKEPIKKFSDYKAPSLDLLRSSVEKPQVGDLRANANIIKRTLDGFGIPVEMGEINIGPKVTRYTLRPAEGIKLSRITALNQDLSLALSAHPIRIEAPIPGRPYVGIEVPNKSAAIVRLGNLMSYPEFAGAGLLGFCLGRDVTGEPIFADIEKMPHLLVAGATGSGKSIALHSILISMLYKNSPQTLKLVLIDPKRVELSVYNGLPHLVAPVITQGKKALGVFRWAIAEMENRYETLLKAGARDTQSYNKKNPEKPLSYIIIVVDEMADLMVAYGRDVENAVVRLAQMARATGIHLILSTQRPSVEVITGLIKANITARVALQVASQIDSRTILDTAGAEKLLGGGDLLFVSAELSKPKRIQGAYISEEEIKKVTDFIRENNEDWAGEEEVFFNGENSSDEEWSRETGKDLFEEYEEVEGDDELLKEAIEVVKQAKKASASLLQRRLKVGYARAARLLDMMEEKGLIGPGEGAKPREVYISSEQDN